MEILVGCDPEFFVKKDGAHVSAYGLVEGNKHNPLAVKKGAVQVDGMALEFNIDPAKDLRSFRGNINGVLGQLRSMVGEEYEFDFSPVAHFGKEYIDQQPDEAKELGCDPDYDAYTGQANPRPNADLPFRTASGHIHIGWTKDMDPFDPGHFEACQMLTKQLDAILAPVSRLWDKDEERRTMYGKLGAFRPKPYGVEYRVLSNAWLRQPETITLVYRAAKHATEHLLQGNQFYANNAYIGGFYDDDPAGWYNYWSAYGYYDRAYDEWLYNLYREAKAEYTRKRNEQLLASMPKKSKSEYKTTRWIVDQGIRMVFDEAAERGVI